MIVSSCGSPNHARGGAFSMRERDFAHHRESMRRPRVAVNTSALESGAGGGGGGRKRGGDAVWPQLNNGRRVGNLDDGSVLGTLCA